MIYAAMHRHFMAEVMSMLHEMTPILIQKSVREAVELMLYRFSELLKKDDGRYLPYMRYMGNLDHTKNTTKIEQVLMDIIMKYVMNNPHLLKAAEHIPRFSYIIINAGIFSIIRHLSTPSPMISFDDLLSGLGDMVESYVDAKLLNLM